MNVDNVFTRGELLDRGLTLRGDNIRVDRSCRLFSPQAISLGQNTRIDCFAILSAGSQRIEIGANVHVGAGCMLFGGGGQICIEDFANLSGRVMMYTSSDDYVDGYMTNPTIPEQFRNVTSGSIHLCRHTIVGAGSVILPGVHLGYGSAVGALTLVRTSIAKGEIVAGIPARRLNKVRDCSRLSILEAQCRNVLGLKSVE